MKRPTRPAPDSFGIDARELVVTLFAGGGGTCTGIAEALQRPVDIAINHWPQAIAMHARNHPETKHYCESVWDVEPRIACGRRKVGFLWASPDCTDHSRAKGGKPKSKGRRALATVVLKWAAQVRPRVIMLENVEEFAEWGPLGEDGAPLRDRRGESFRAWVADLELQGYRVEWRSLVAADFGAPTTRKRLYLIARCDGLPIVWPEPTHGAGRGKAWRSAAECIDFTLPCPSIFTRSRPLAERTLQRIARGVVRYVLDAARPFVVPYYGTGVADPVSEPLATVTTRDRFALVTPFVAGIDNQSSGATPVWPASRPLTTIVTENRHALVAPTLIQTGYGEREGQAPRALDITEPLGTVVACGAKHAVAAAFLARHYGGNENDGAPLTRPMHTVTCQDHHALVTVYGHGDHRDEVRQLLARFGYDREPVVTIDGQRYVVADLGMRMLQPRELFNAQGFPADYRLDAEVEKRGRMVPLTKTELIELCGNAVAPPVACALVRANFGVPAGRMAA